MRRQTDAVGCASEGAPGKLLRPKAHEAQRRQHVEDLADLRGQSSALLHVSVLEERSHIVLCVPDARGELARRDGLVLRRQRTAVVMLKRPMRACGSVNERLAQCADSPAEGTVRQKRDSRKGAPRVQGGAG